MWKRNTAIGTLLLALVSAATAYYLNRSKPLYAQVVFGPEARLRVWFILDGYTLYLDRSGGDMPRRAERLPGPTGPSQLRDCKIHLADPDGRTRYIITKVSPIYTRQAVQRGEQQELYLDVTITGPVGYLQSGSVRMADRPELAGIGHLHGPLTVAPWPAKNLPPLRFDIGGTPTNVYAVVTTQQSNGDSWIAIRSENAERNGPAFPTSVFPMLDVEFPSKVAGGPPVRHRFALNEPC
jgi:hypothetical protein